MTKRIDTIVIGAGQAGLAMSRCLSRAGVEHAVLERGRIGERWRNERWPSLKLLTPNWMMRLPGLTPDTEDPHGFMPARAFARLLDRYADASGALVFEETQVLSVARSGETFLVATSRGGWRARAVVIATGACDRPVVPKWGARLPRDIHQLTPDRYLGAHFLPDGGVLVVGASATGVQLAHEIRRSGRAVTLAVGRHVRTPRRYRGRDIYEWLDAAGFLQDPRAEGVHRYTAQPSFQLVGDHANGALGLDRLAAAGVEITGRAVAADGCTVAFADDLHAQCSASETRRRKVLARIDRFIDEAGVAAPLDRDAWAAPETLPTAPTTLDLRARGINTVLWATGFRRAYPWLDVPVLDDAGEIINRGGVTPEPGLYVLGLPFMRHRSSSLIDGVGRDAEALSALVARRLEALSAAL